MKIILHNPGHNGDQLHTLGIIKQFINDNLDKEFIIVPACSMYLFNELLSDKVIIEEHPVTWNNTTNLFNNSNNKFINKIHDILWIFHENNIYINMWKLLVQDNYNCISLANRITFINNMLEEINNKIGIKIYFNCNNYKELIPILPYVDFDYICEKLKSYNKKFIFFYNQNSFSGFESFYKNDMNEIIIKNLIDNYGEDYIIILSKPSNINHKNLINVETEFGIIPSLDGKNLIINANIANLCDAVYFKLNGGSQFILNQINIANKNVKYNFIGPNNFYQVINNEYQLNVKLYK